MEPSSENDNNDVESDEDESEGSTTRTADSSSPIFLHPDARELEQASKTWWNEFYGKEEFEARKAASELMSKKLSDLDRDALPYGRAWNHAIYSGTSKTGAEVGVMAVRFDEEDDDDADYDE